MTVITERPSASTLGTVRCPDWCVIDHSQDWASPEDVFHRGASVDLVTPKESRPRGDEQISGPYLTAHLMLPELPQDSDPPAVILDCGDVYGPYAQMQVEHLDQYIRDQKVFTARLQVLRDRLAETAKAVKA